MGNPGQSVEISGRLDAYQDEYHAYGTRGGTDTLATKPAA